MIESIKRGAEIALRLLKRGAETAFYYTRKVFGAFVGATLFSSTALVLNLLIALALLALSLAISVILPVAAAYFSYKYTHNVYASFISTLMALGLNRLIIPPAMILGTAVAVLKTIRDLFHTFSYGLIEGYTKGATHVLGQWWKTPFDFLNYLGERPTRDGDNSLHQVQETFSRLLGTSSHSLRVVDYSSNDASFPGLELAIRESFIQSQPRAATVPTLTRTEYKRLEISPTSQEFLPLTTEELEKAAAISKLKPIVEHYRDLDSRLDKLGENTRDDELIAATAIEKPILLVKQTRSKSGTWVAVPGCTWISDKENLWSWAKDNATNPINRDLLKDTKDSPTRYRYSDYSTKSSAQELREAVATIRAGLAPTPVKNEEESTSLYQRFFGKSNPQESAQVSAKPQVHSDTSSYTS